MDSKESPRICIAIEVTFIACSKKQSEESECKGKNNTKPVDTPRMHRIPRNKTFLYRINMQRNHKESSKVKSFSKGLLYRLQKDSVDY